MERYYINGKPATKEEAAAQKKYNDETLNSLTDITADNLDKWLGIGFITRID